MFEDIDDRFTPNDYGSCSGQDNPEISPTIEEPTFTPNFFNCTGEASITDKLLNPGFIQNGELDYVFSNWEQLPPITSAITLFNRDYEDPSTILSDVETLFRKAGYNLKLLISKSQDVRNPFEVRSDIIKFVSLLRHWVFKTWRGEQYEWIMKDIIEKIQAGFVGLNLSSFPDCVCHVTGNNSKISSFHLCHCYLELKWLVLTTKFYLCCYSEDAVIEGSSFERELKDVLSGLIHVGLQVFNKGNLKISTPFSCVCCKELWIMIVQLTTRLQMDYNYKSFWTLYNEVLDSIPSPDPIYSIWLTYHIALLQGYSSAGVYIGKSDSITSNYSNLNINLKSLVNDDTRQIESELRSILPFVHYLILEWWNPSLDPIATLWEYYYRRLNDTFYLPVDSPESMAIICRNSTGLLQQIEARLSLPVENSFNQFLKLLGLFLKHCHEANLMNQVQKLKGRIFFKFLPKKMAMLDDVGLYHFVSLFLTMAVTSDLKEMSSKLQSLLMSIPSIEITPTKTPIIFSTHLALLQLHVQSSHPIDEVASLFILHLRDIDKDLSNTEIRKIVTDGVQSIFEASEKFTNGEHVLIDNVICQYLKINQNKLLDVLISVVKKLHKMRAENPQMNQMIFQHVLPVLKSQVTHAATCDEEVAELIFWILMLTLADANLAAKNSASFFKLFNYFVTSHNVSLTIVHQLMTMIINEPTTMKELEISFTNYHIIVIQIWLQSHLLSPEPKIKQNLNTMSKAITQLPFIQSTFPEMDSDITDSLSHFLMTVSNSYYASGSDRLKITEFLSDVLKGIDHRILEILRSKVPEQRLIVNTYTVVAKLFNHCSQIIYIKNTSACFFHILVTQMLLPPALFTGRKLHSFCVEAIRKNWSTFFMGISKHNEPSNDPYIEKTLQDLIVQYIPYFANKPNELKRPQPFLCLLDLKPQFIQFSFEHITTHFLLITGGKQPNQHACAALHVVTEIFQSIKSEVPKVLQLVQFTLNGILEQIMFLDQNDPSKKISVDLFNQICEAVKTEMRSGECKIAFLYGLRKLVKKHLGFYASSVMRLLTFLAQKYPALISAFMPELTEEVKNVEAVRCVPYDTLLRTSLAQVGNVVLKHSQ